MNALALAPNFFDIALERMRRWLVALAGLTTALCTSFKVELMEAKHDFTAGTGNAFFMMLFKQTALIVGTYGAATTNYANVTGNADELANGSGYTTGGVALGNTTPLSTGTVAYTTPNGNAVWTVSTFTTRGCLVYNSTNGNRSVFVYDFGADEPVVAGTFTVSMPVNASATALLQLA